VITSRYSGKQSRRLLGGQSVDWRGKGRRIEYPGAHSSGLSAMSKALKITALIVSYNRRETTLNAIRALIRNSGRVSLTIVLFDDGSKDQTSESVKESFPEVIVKRGDGTFFWNGGLHQSWLEALNQRSDAVLWLNDDVTIDENVFEKILACWHVAATRRPDRGFILVGATRDSQQNITYGGLIRKDSWLSYRDELVTPGANLVEIDTFEGNFVIVPQEVTQLIGLNDPAYHHNFGDVDYGLRARKAGIDVLLLPGTVGVCERNARKYEYGYGSPTLSIFEQWRKVNSHHGLPPRNWFRFTTRHSGFYFPIHFLAAYRHLVIPRWAKARRAPRR
jgi:GT2 family glycosyltransferase